MKDLSLMQVKQNMIDAVMDSLSGMQFQTEEERALYKEDLIKEISSKRLVTTLRPQSGLTNATDFNVTNYELYLDLMTAFQYINDVYEVLSKHEELNRSILNTLHSTVAELNDRLDEYEAIASPEGAKHCFVEGFRSKYNFAEEASLYKERYGEAVQVQTHCKHHPEEEEITLNYTRRNNVLTYENGVQLGNLSITKQYGAGFIRLRNAQAKLEYAVDTSLNTYWSETILADDQIKIKGMGYEDSSSLGTYNRSYYDLPQGALCELCITFEAMAKVNELSLLPYGEFPIDVVAIRYCLTDEETEDCYDVIYPDAPYQWLQPRSISGGYTFRFPEIACKKLYLLINQLHFIKNTYLLSTDAILKNELWFNSTYNDDVLRKENSTVFLPLYLDRAEEDLTWKYINNKVLSQKHVDINALLLENKNKMIPHTKYQYSYGFYNIAPRYVELERTGVYLSKPIQSNGSIKSITLTTDEEHFTTKTGEIVTDIEYYITNKETPSVSDWKPILPTNCSYIERELLQLDYAYCYLRFPGICDVPDIEDIEEGATSIRPVVRRNDTILTENKDYLLRFNDREEVEAIEIANIDPFALYTVSYTPVRRARELNLIEDVTADISTGFEEIQGTGVTCYPLKNFPYYNQTSPEETSTYVKIIDTNLNTVYNQSDSKTAQIQCVTNKKNPNSSYKNFTQTGVIQYYTDLDYIYFNRAILPSERIEINYPCFSSKLRLKAILRRNCRNETWLTPVLRRYQIECATI